MRPRPKFVPYRRRSSGIVMGRMGDEKEAQEHTVEQQGGLPRRGAVLADRYRVLGVGGMGSVHRVLDTELDEEVALKLLRPEITRDADALHRFRRELKLARRVTHPNVARTYDLGVHEGTRFITMELIEGSPLSRPIRMGGALALGEALRVAAEIARGLAAAHAVGIVHRDLKPDNVMLAGERVCLTDFGIARLAEDVAGDTRYTVGPIGTPAYMAPEQVEGRPLDGRADVYALGVLLFECLTGRLPFDAQTALGMAAARLTEDAPDPRAHDPGIPAGVSELVLAMMTRAREERLDAQRALERLDAIRGEGGARVPAVPAHAPRRALVPTSDRWAVVARFDAPDAAALAAQLDEAVQEAFEGLRRFERVRAPASAAALEDVELAKRSGADLVLRGTVRVAGPRVRIRLRLAERTDGHTLWQQKIDGATDDPFALEDEVVRVVRTFLADRFSTPGTIERGPADPKRREIYLRARALMLEHSRDSYARAIELLEDALAADPNDPWILSRLAAALVRRLSIAGVEVDAKASEARAEELALRALALDSSIPDTYQTVGVLRWMQGRTRSAVLALREALARDPFLLEAQGLLARLASESGRTEEAIERAHLLLRIEPEMQWHVRVVLARIAADRGIARRWSRTSRARIGTRAAAASRWSRGSRTPASTATPRSRARSSRRSTPRRTGPGRSRSGASSVTSRESSRWPGTTRSSARSCAPTRPSARGRRRRSSTRRSSRPSTRPPSPSSTASRTRGARRSISRGSTPRQLRAHPREPPLRARAGAGRGSRGRGLGLSRRARRAACVQDLSSRRTRWRPRRAFRPRARTRAARGLRRAARRSR
ncbi:MAG: protein kinase [Sandaracinaceae bacterium]|nr:protein kinase [Sandaracinaceae bacterium]